jgi:hypothetical protein
MVAFERLSPISLAVSVRSGLASMMTIDVDNGGTTDPVGITSPVMLSVTTQFAYNMRERNHE